MATDAEKAVNVGSNSDQLEIEPPFLKKIKVAQENEDNKIWLCINMCIGWRIFSIIFALLPIAMIYFGARNLHNCTISKFIPIYLLVQGICTLLDQILIFCQCRTKETESITNKKTLLSRLFDTFVFVWFIVGSVFVYKIYEPNYNEAFGEYCDKTTYLFAFWSITVVYAIIALVLFSCCCICLIACCYLSKDDDDD